MGIMFEAEPAISAAALPFYFSLFLLFSLKPLATETARADNRNKDARGATCFRKLTGSWSIADCRLRFSREILPRIRNDDSLRSIYSISHEGKDRIVYINSHMIIS
jgi:hypothetical protein